VCGSRGKAGRAGAEGSTCELCRRGTHEYRISSTSSTSRLAYGKEMAVLAQHGGEFGEESVALRQEKRKRGRGGEEMGGTVRRRIWRGKCGGERREEKERRRGRVR
jgi:hypothetical protein